MDSFQGEHVSGNEPDKESNLSPKSEASHNEKTTQLTHAASNSKHKKIILKTPKGTRDRGPAQMQILKKVFSLVTDVFELHDAVAIETPVFELRDILTGKYGEDSKLIYDLCDQGGELTSLRYDLTVPFARYVAMNKIKKIRRYAIGTVYRRDQPAMNSGRFREFYQCDFDIAGEGDLMMADFECIQVIHRILSRLDLGNFVIKISHRRFLDAMCQVCGVPKEKFTTICSAIDKLDKMPWEEVRKEMVQEKGLSEAAADAIGEYVNLPPGGLELVEKMRSDPRLSQCELALQSLNELETLLGFCKLVSIHHRVLFDLSLARGLDYYTGLIFEAVVTDFQHTPQASQSCSSKPRGGKSKHKATSADGDDATSSTGVGSVAGGGRYDNLVGQFCSTGVPCVGLSIGIERILAVFEARRAAQQTQHPQILSVNDTQVMVVGAHKNLNQQRLVVADLLRCAGIKTACSERYNPRFLDQLNNCENNGIPYAVVIGQTEWDREPSEVKLRNIVSRKEVFVRVDELIGLLISPDKLAELFSNE